MAAINFEDYLSTSVRWAMFKADWPDASIEFSESTPSEIGIPSTFSKKDEKICVAHVARYKGDESPIVAYKAESDVRGPKDTDSWHALCSKAMGRAMKKAGYPDTMGDLKTLINFRKTNKTEQPEAKTTSVAGVQISTPTIQMESKEKPARPSIDWSSDAERDMAHNSFKARCVELTDDERGTLRTHHEKLNGKAWPMSRSELNNLSVCLEGIYAHRNGAEVEESTLVDTSPLKSIYEMLNEDTKKDVMSAYGSPDKWPDKVSEHEYEEMLEVFSFAEED